MKGGEGAARRYARALVEVALEKGETGLQKDLETLGQLYGDHAELRTLLLHPAVPPDKKVAVVGALLGGRPSELVSRLVRLLGERDRIELLPLIARAYTRQWNAQKGIVEAEAVSAQPLDEAQARAVAAAAAKAVGGKQVDLRRRVDPSLMGGLLLRMEGRVFDGSVRARLRSLREQLAGGKA